MKKIITLFFTVILLFCSIALVGCSEKKASVDTKNSDAPSVENKNESSEFADAKNNTNDNVQNDNKQGNQAPKAELMVFADLSVKDAFNEINQLFEAENNISIKSNYAVSGTLQKQIKNGEIADVFVSSGFAPIDSLIQSGNAQEDQITDLMANSIVLIVPKSKAEKIKSIDDLSSIDGNIVIAMDKDPVRQYTDLALNSLNLWDELKNRFIFANSSSDVVKYVDAEEGVAGIAYKTDALKGKNSIIVSEIDPSLYQGAVYAIVVLNSAKNNDNAHKYDDFLHSQIATKIFEKYGFIVQ